MAQIKLTITDELKDLIESIRVQNGLKTLPETCVMLIALQVDFQGKAMNTWGGNRLNNQTESLDTEESS